MDNTVQYGFNKRSHKQHDICEVEHDEVRRVLVENGKKTAKWIRSNLVDNNDFVCETVLRI